MRKNWKIAIALALALCFVLALMACNDDGYVYVYETDEAGETVTLGALKEKGLVPASAGRLTILASGLLDKPLVIVANKFAPQALHNITLAGGKAIEIK